MKKSLILVVMLLSNQISFSQWSTDPTINNPVCTNLKLQQYIRIVSDGSSGAIISWLDYDQNTNQYNIYAQRINAEGIIQWTADGVEICTNTSLQTSPEIASDGNGGAFIVWQDNRSGVADIYAQYINSNGVVQWAVDGIAVCDSIRDQTSPQVINDGNGNAIITWRDLRSGITYTPYAQKLNSNGAELWYTGGVALSPKTSENILLVSDGNGGAIITWHQYNSNNFDITAQHINSNGSVQWGTNGISLCSLPTDQLRPQIISDENNGAIIVWEDKRNGSNSTLYAQKVNSAGSIQWAADGEAIALNTSGQIRQKLLSDGNGGAYITWQYVNLYSIYAQRIDSNGDTQWAADGISIGSVADSRFPEIATDGAGGAIITWYDFRGFGNGDIFAQRVDFSGNILWAVNGVSICTNPSGQVSPRLVETGNGDVIITWGDDRNSGTSSTDIYAQEVSSGGMLGQITNVIELPELLTEFTLLQNYPNPFNPSTVISYQLPVSGDVKLKVFDLLGREVATLVDEFKSAGNYEVEFNTSSIKHLPSSGVYFYKISAGSFTQTRKMILVK